MAREVQPPLLKIGKAQNCTQCKNYQCGCKGAENATNARICENNNKKGGTRFVSVLG